MVRACGTTLTHRLWTPSTRTCLGFCSSTTATCTLVMGPSMNDQERQALTRLSILLACILAYGLLVKWLI